MLETSQDFLLAKLVMPRLAAFLPMPLPSLTPIFRLSGKMKELGRLAVRKRTKLMGLTQLFIRFVIL